MTCRHAEGDPRCKSGNSPEDLAKKASRDFDRWVRSGSAPAVPDPRVATLSQDLDATRRALDAARKALKDIEISGEKFEVVDMAQIREHLVLRVEYPSCAKCSYEGRKVMVFLHTTPLDVLRWKKIDPHFRDKPASKKEAPSPAARFPASDDGWKDALAYAMSKGGISSTTSA